jgi:Spy/CpxP family protein refolding chaperone
MGRGIFGRQIRTVPETFLGGGGNFRRRHFVRGCFPSDSTASSEAVAGRDCRCSILRQQYLAMKLFKSWKLILMLVLVFAAGATSGVAWTHLQFKRAFEGCLKYESWTTQVMNHLQKKLNLTPEQQPKARAIVEETGLKLKATFGKTMKETGVILVDSWRSMDAVLTPEQRAIHDQMTDEFRKDVKKALDFDLPSK